MQLYATTNFCTAKMSFLREVHAKIFLTPLSHDSVNKSKQSCYKSCTHRKQIRSPVTTLFQFFKMEILSLKQHSRVWFGFVLIAAHFLTPSFKATCTILSMCNGWFDVSVVCCTVTASFLVLLMHSLPEYWAGREGSDC